MRLEELLNAHNSVLFTYYQRTSGLLHDTACSGCTDVYICGKRRGVYRTQRLHMLHLLFAAISQAVVTAWFISLASIQRSL
jgi:hypothetical protein